MLYSITNHYQSFKLECESIDWFPYEMQHRADSRNIAILEKIPCFSSFHQIVGNFESKMFILKGPTIFFNSVQQKVGNHQCKFSLTHHTVKHPNKFTHPPPPPPHQHQQPHQACYKDSTQTQNRKLSQLSNRFKERYLQIYVLEMYRFFS